MKKQKKIARIGMVITTMIWGITFVMVKDALNDAGPYMFSFLRFGLAFLIGVIYSYKTLKLVSKEDIIAGLICGIALFAGYAFQNFGLMNTTPTKSAFITSVSVLIVPLLLVVFNIQKVKIRIWIAVSLATLGLYLLILPGEGGINIGDLLTFCCAISFALHIIIQDNYLKKQVPILPFFCVQLSCVTLISFLNAQFFEPQTIIWSQRLIIAIIITGVFATFIAFLIMIWAQKILNPSETAIIFSMEPVAAALFAVLLWGEVLGLLSWLGGGLICLGVIYGETGKNKIDL